MQPQDQLEHCKFTIYSCHNLTRITKFQVLKYRGYMAPEYLANGLFSFKSDVFSFGVLVLEILSGKRNQVFNQTDMSSNLLVQVSITLKHAILFFMD